MTKKELSNYITKMAKKLNNIQESIMTLGSEAEELENLIDELPNPFELDDEED